MRKSLYLAVMFGVILFGAEAQTIVALPPGAEATEARLLMKVGPQTRALIRREAAKQRGRQTFDESLTADLKRIGNLNDSDVEALTLLVMMEAARAQQEDLKAIIDGVKQINDAKELARRTVTKGAPTVARPRATISRAAISLVPRSKQDLDAQINRAKNDLDSLSELGEMESLRLQMAMDRQSKTISTLSNIMKKVSDTNATIMQNLK